MLCTTSKVYANIIEQFIFKIYNLKIYQHQCWHTMLFVTNSDDFFTSNLEYNDSSWDPISVLHHLWQTAMISSPATWSTMMVVGGAPHPCTTLFMVNGDDFFTSNWEYNDGSWWCPPSLFMEWAPVTPSQSMVWFSFAAWSVMAEGCTSINFWCTSSPLVS